MFIKLLNVNYLLFTINIYIYIYIYINLLNIELECSIWIINM